MKFGVEGHEPIGIAYVGEEKSLNQRWLDIKKRKKKLPVNLWYLGFSAAF